MTQGTIDIKRYLENLTADYFPLFEIEVSVNSFTGRCWLNFLSGPVEIKEIDEFLCVPSDRFGSLRRSRSFGTKVSDEFLNYFEEFFTGVTEKLKERGEQSMYLTWVTFSQYAHKPESGTEEDAINDLVVARMTF